MVNSISVNKSQRSKVRRLSFLPRIGFVVDFANRSVTYRQAPMIETLVNLYRRGFSFKNFMAIATSQLEEIKTHEFKINSPANRKVKGHSRRKPSSRRS